MLIHSQNETLGDHHMTTLLKIDGSIDVLTKVVKKGRFKLLLQRFAWPSLLCVPEMSSFRWKQLPLNLYQNVLESLLASLQTVSCQALHVAVHTEPHVTPAAYPLAVQFNQADDMQHDIPQRSVPLTASSGLWMEGGRGGYTNLYIPCHPLWRTKRMVFWVTRNESPREIFHCIEAIASN